MKKEKVCQKWSAVRSHGYTYYLPKNSIANLDADIIYKEFYLPTNLSSVILWSRVDAASDQYAVPSLFITMYFAPLILYAALISRPMLSRSRSWGVFVYRVEKSKLSKCLAPLVLLTFLSFFRTSVALSIIHKQLTPAFLVIPSQYCLKCLVINLRPEISNCDNGLVVHALEAAMNLSLIHI